MHRVAVQLQECSVSQNIHLPLIDVVGGKQRADADGLLQSYNKDHAY